MFFHILQANEIIDVGDEDEEMCMEKCYESYIEMGGNSPKYVVPNDNKRSQTSVDDEEEHDTPRPECEDRFAGYDGLNYNDNRIQKAKENEIQKQIDEYKVFGRMTEKEVQLALLMKRVKERYITQEQALEMVRVLRLVVRAFKLSIKLKSSLTKILFKSNMTMYFCLSVNNFICTG